MEPDVPEVQLIQAVQLSATKVVVDFTPPFPGAAVAELLDHIEQLDMVVVVVELVNHKMPVVVFPDKLQFLQIIDPALQIQFPPFPTEQFMTKELLVIVTVVP